MPKKINFPKDIIQEALTESIKIEKIQKYILMKIGIMPSKPTVYRWLREFSNEQIEDTRTTNQYIEDVENKYRIMFGKTKTALDRATTGEEMDKILEEFLENEFFHDPNKLYPVLIESLKKGRLSMAQRIILFAKVKHESDIETFFKQAEQLDYSEHSGVLYSEINNARDTIQRMDNIDSVIKSILGYDTDKSNLQKFTFLLNKAHKLAKSENATPDAKQYYEKLLENGLIIFPYDIKLKNRYVNLLIKNKRFEDAKLFINESLKNIDIENLPEQDRLPYLKLRNNLVRVEKIIQSENKKPLFDYAKRISEETLLMDPTNFDAQFQLAHLHLLEGNYLEADRRVMILSDQVELDKYCQKYYKVEKEVVRSLRQSIMQARIKQFGRHGVIKQENEKNPVELEDTLFADTLKEIQSHIYLGDLNYAKELLGKLPTNAQDLLSTQYVRMQYQLATGNGTKARNLYEMVRNQYSHKNSEKQKKIQIGMRKLMDLNDRINESEERIEYIIE